MKLFFPLVLYFYIMGCTSNPDNANRGSHGSQDYPSNREDRDNNTPVHEEKNSTVPVDSNGIKSEAPNNADTTPHQDISGQTGTNQTGKK